jgi:hypothetical protein
MYHFEEADPTVELGTYSQMLDIEVRKPLTISLSPLSVHICEFEEGLYFLRLILSTFFNNYPR